MSGGALRDSITRDTGGTAALSYAIGSVLICWTTRIRRVELDG